MTLKEYIKSLQDFAEKNPDCLEMTVITSKDDEGNGFNKIHYGPAKGEFDENSKDFDTDGNPNAVCVN